MGVVFPELVADFRWLRTECHSRNEILEMPIRLFRVPPGDVYEHPPHYPTDPKQVPLGPIDGWECYALSHTADHQVIVFDPVVVEDGVGKHIKTNPASPHRNSDYWYSDTYSLRSARPCWYQSGDTLRFIRKSTPPAESTEEGVTAVPQTRELEPAGKGNPERARAGVARTQPPVMLPRRRASTSGRRTR